MKTKQLPNLGATHLNHICDNAFDARTRGLPKLNVALIDTNFDAYRAYELGWHRGTGKEDFLALQKEAEDLGLAHAKGQDMPNDDLRMKVISEIMEASPWTLHPDYGCVLATEAEELDRLPSEHPSDRL